MFITCYQLLYIFYCHIVCKVNQLLAPTIYFSMVPISCCFQFFFHIIRNDLPNNFQSYPLSIL